MSNFRTSTTNYEYLYKLYDQFKVGMILETTQFILSRYQINCHKPIFPKIRVGPMIRCFRQWVFPAQLPKIRLVNKVNYVGTVSAL